MAENSTVANPESLSASELTSLQPGFARLMPEIGARFWKCYHAAAAANWPLARWQLKETQKLFQLGTVTRPKYTDDVTEYLHDELGPLMSAIDARDFPAFARTFGEAVDSANEYHRRWNKEFIVWKLPAQPPLDLDLTPQEETPQ